MAENPNPNPQPNPSSDLQSQWSNFFKSPAVISGLIQFGASALTPGTGIGPAISQGAAAATRALQFQQAGEAAKTAGALKQREVTAKERQAGASEQRAQAGTLREERQLRSENRKQITEEEKLNLQKRRLEEYLIPSLKKRGAGAAKKPYDPTRDVFQGFLEQAMNAPIESTLEEDDPLFIEMSEDPVGYAIRKTAESMGKSGAAPGGTIPATAGPSAPTGQPAGTAGPSTAGPARQTTEEGTIPFEQLSDADWVLIMSRPDFQQQAIEMYGVRAQAKLQQMKDRQEMKSPGILQNLEGVGRTLSGQ